MMHITDSRLQEISDGFPIGYMEAKALAQYALDVQALPDKWRVPSRLYDLCELDEAYNEGQWDCAEELDWLSRSK